MRVGRAVQHRAHQAGAKRGEESHRIERRLAPHVQCSCLRGTAEQPLVGLQRGADFLGVRPQAPVGCGGAFARQHATQRQQWIVDGVFAHPARSLLGQPVAPVA